jgi:endonuclease/exonuclease/phosphatase family metal-dependent hydrolase
MPAEQSCTHRAFVFVPKEPPMPDYRRLNDDPNRVRIMDGLLRLRAELDASPIPDKNLETSLLLATWNIREFDSTKYGVRTSDAYYYLAEIISRFDIVAIQEVRRDLAALIELRRHLGWPWHYLVSDTTEGKAGNEERLAYLYDSRKVRPTGLVGELVLPPVSSPTEAGTTVPAAQIARTPFSAGFTAGWVSFQLATVHILYGDDRAELPERIEEIRQVAAALSKRAQEKFAAAENLVLLGDFNIYDRTDATMQALLDEGWVIPEALKAGAGSNLAQSKHYDQIAIRPKTHRFQPTDNAGVFNFAPSVFRTGDFTAYTPDMGAALDTTSDGAPRADKPRYYRDWSSYQMSDHLPMWVELKIDYSQEYLAELRGAPQDVITP